MQDLGTESHLQGLFRGRAALLCLAHRLPDRAQQGCNRQPELSVADGIPASARASVRREQAGLPARCVLCIVRLSGEQARTCAWPCVPAQNPVRGQKAGRGVKHTRTGCLCPRRPPGSRAQRMHPPG